MQHPIRAARLAATLRATLLATSGFFLSAGSALAAPTSIDLPGNRAFPESLSSSRDGTLYVGNLADGGVLRIRPLGSPEHWIKPGAFESASILGVLVDEASNILWVCSNDFSSIGLKISGAAAGSALIGFDLETGSGKVRAQFPGDHNLCNDMAIGADGSVYVTNSDAPQILRLAAGGQELQVWFSNPSLQPVSPGGGLDGIAFGHDGNLYVDRFDAADLFRIDVKNGQAGQLTKLRPSRKLVFTDAIRPASQDVFLLIEGSGRLDSLTIQGDTANIVTLREGYATPTGVTRVGNVAWVSEGQLDYLYDPTKHDQKPRVPFKLFAVPLPAYTRGRSPE